jgi:hypothetical protein
MPSTACQDMNVIVSCAIRRGPGVIMNVLVQRHCAVDIFFNVAQLTTMTIICMILMSTTHISPGCQFENVLTS